MGKQISIIKDNEYKRTLLTSKEEKINNKIVRFNDDLLPDMYSNNYFEVSNKIDENDYNLMREYKKHRKESHLKIVCPKRNKLLLNKEMEESVLLTMLKTDFEYPTDLNKSIVIKCCKNEDIEEDLTRLELKHYGSVYGEDFTIRKSHRLFSLAKKQDNNLYYFGAYIGRKIVGSCSLYFEDQIAALDDLLTDKDYRYQNIATTLMKYVHEYFNCPIFLHADLDDTPKEMYMKLGYKIVKEEYEYFKLDENK